MSFVQFSRPPLNRASPWLIRLRIAPTISATTKDRRGTPSDTQQRHIVKSGDIRRWCEPLLSELYTDQRRQLRERRDLAVRLSRQALRSLAVAVAPNDAHAEGRSGISVPGIGRLERDRAGRGREAIDGELIDLGVRLVDAHQLYRQNSVEELSDPGLLHHCVEHLRRAVRQDRG